MCYYTLSLIIFQEYFKDYDFIMNALIALKLIITLKVIFKKSKF